MSVTIHTVEAENLKRVIAASFTVTQNGLVSIGGRNGEGKTSLLDAICWTLGGDRFRPSDRNNNQTGENARTKVTLSNGLIAERKGKNGTLTVTDPDGKKGGQAILNEVIEMLALDLPRFMDAKDKGKYLLGILGVEDELQKLEAKEKSLYDEREAFGRDAKQAKGYAEELPFYEDAPEKAVSAQELIQKQQALLLKNAKNQKQRERVPEITKRIEDLKSSRNVCTKAIDEKKARIAELQEEIQGLEKTQAADLKTQEEEEANLETAKKTAEQLQDESTAEIEKQLADVEATNDKVRANKEKQKAEEKAEKLQAQYKDKTDQIAAVRKDIRALLEGADLPLPELTVEGGELKYKGEAWDCMSGAEQLKVATAIVRKLNPECGFVLVDKLEQMDVETLKEFGAWCEAEDLQVIGTRVSSGDECSLIIEDGRLGVDADYNICPIPGTHNGKAWKDVPQNAREYALANPGEFPMLDDDYFAAIKKSLET